ncbi:MAG: TetR/AcrR family transcriptional regulator [Bacteroidia bacterium]
MELQLKFRMNEQLYLRNPQESDLGRRIISASVRMIGQMGFESFTFKKLATEIETTEASVYRYFENKHRLLVYMVTWYWSWLEYRVMVSGMNTDNVELKIKRIIRLLIEEFDESPGMDGIDQQALYHIVVWEGSKAYLTRHVTEDNQARLFKPYKDLTSRIAAVLKEYNPKYKYSRSLASTLIEMAHYQTFFMQNLPSLTDFAPKKDTKEVSKFLEHMVFACLNK